MTPSLYLKGSAHLEEGLLGGNVDLYLIFQSPQKVAKIMGGMGSNHF
jgi:hypothetical protein